MVQTRGMATREAKSHGYEFGGPFGAAVISFGLPLVCYAFAFLCNDVSGCPAPTLLHPYSFDLNQLKRDVAWPGFGGLLNIKAFVGMLAYYASSLVFYAILPAQEVEGVELSGGGRLKYRLNAFPTALATLAVIAGGTILQGIRFPLWDFLWDNYVPLLTSNIIIAFALATYVYVRSFSVGAPRSSATDGPTPGRKQAGAGKREGGDLFTHRELAAGGHSGNMIYDWFIGRELNPPVQIPLIGTVDIKSFMELRPGMLGWLILNLAFIARQYKLYNTITPSILITTASQAIYIFDALYNEPAILTTMDITTDGFGVMLAFGDLVWLPFTYSLQARYLAIHPVRLSPLLLALIITAQCAGYYIFRAANSQKNTFRTNPTDPSVASLSFIQTKAGSRLLTDGWWGRARHVNYLGDWLMSWAYVLPTGFAGYQIQRSSPFRDNPNEANAAIIRDDNSLAGGLEVIPGEAAGWGMVVTYFFMLYFAILLVHRERRDEEKCRRKYGKDWDEYCRRVPSRILPGIY